MADDPSESPTEPVSPAGPDATPSPTPEPPTRSTPPPAAPTPAAPSTATPAARARERRRQPPPLPQLVTELRDLVVAYIKQQTISPLKNLGKYVGFGLLGSLLLGFGVVFLGVGGLRVLQTETGDTFTGDWSWAPYLIMVLVLALGAALVWMLRSRPAEQEAQ